MIWPSGQCYDRTDFCSRVLSLTLEQACTNYGPRDGCGPPYTFILFSKVINKH
jgi:hypothetical protein